MDNLSDKLKTVLSDADSMARIMEIAKGLSVKNGGAAAESSAASPAREATVPSEDEQEKTEQESAPRGEEKKAPSSPFDLLRMPGLEEFVKLASTGSKERVALLQAMRPFVKPEKKEKIDKAIQAMNTLDLLASAQKLL